MERHFLYSLILDNALDDIRSEATEMSEDERMKRLLQLKDERDVLELDEKGMMSTLFFLSRQMINDYGFL